MNYLKLNIAIQKLLKIQNFDTDIDSYIESPEFADLVDYLKEVLLSKYDASEIISTYFASLCNSVSTAYYLETVYELLLDRCQELFDNDINFFNDNSKLVYKGTNKIDDEDEYEYTELYNNVEDFIILWDYTYVVDCYRKLNQ